MSEHVEIITIIDQSGSMEKLQHDVIGGFNKFLDEQKKEPGEAVSTLAFFNHEYLPQHAGVPLPEVKHLDDKTYIPGGMTALLDAVGRTLYNARTRISALPEEKRPRLVICGIITDGYENSSREYTKAQIRELVTKCEAEGWKFIFQGANVDSFAETQGLGMMHAISRNYTPDSKGLNEAAAFYCSSVSSMRQSSFGQDSYQDNEFAKKLEELKNGKPS